MFINGLADVLASKYKVKIFEGSRVLFKDMTLDGVVPAESGGRIKARDGVVLATNSPINHNGRRAGAGCQVHAGEGMYVGVRSCVEQAAVD
jgi:hypothetical protein